MIVVYSHTLIFKLCSLLYRHGNLRGKSFKPTAYDDADSDSSSSEDEDSDDESKRPKKKIADKLKPKKGIFGKINELLLLVSDVNKQLNDAAELAERIKNVFLWVNFTATFCV